MNRRNVLFGLGTMVVGGGGALATGAFTSVEAQRTVTVAVAEDDKALIGLNPTESVDGDLVYLDGGELTVDLSESNLGAGINPEAELRIDSAFTITNNYDSNVDITLSDDGGDASENGSEVELRLEDANDEVVASGEELNDFTLYDSDSASGSNYNSVTADLVVDTKNVTISEDESADEFDVTLTITAEPST